MNSRNTAIAVIGVFVLAALALCVVSDDSDAAVPSIDNVEFIDGKQKFDLYFSSVLNGYWSFEATIDGTQVAYGEGSNPGVAIVGLHLNKGAEMVEGGSYKITATYGSEKVEYTYTYTHYVVGVTAEGGSVTGAGTYVSGHSVTLTATADEGYYFLGWYIGDDLVSTETSYTFLVHGNASYTAAFDNMYTIRFLNDDGTVLSEKMYAYGTLADDIVKPVPTKEQTQQYVYTFSGWDKTVVSVVGNETYTATYTSELRKYTVTFQTNGGSSIGPASVEYGKTVSKPSDPSRSGYIFAGWYSDSALTASFDFGTAVMGDITVYAKWNTYTPTPTPTPDPKPDPKPEPEPEPSVPVVPDKEDGTYENPDGSTTTIKTAEDGSKTVVIVNPIDFGTETEVQAFDNNGKYTGSTITTETDETTAGGYRIVSKVTEVRDGTGTATSKVTEVESVSDDGSVKIVVRNVENATGVVSSSIDTVINVFDEDGKVSDSRVRDILATVGSYSVDGSKKTLRIVSNESKDQIFTVTVSPESLASIIDTGMDVTMGSGSMTIGMTDDVIENLSGKKGDVVLSFGNADKTKLNQNQIKRAGDSLVLFLAVKVGDEDVHQLGGKVTVTLPYELRGGQTSKNVKVYYLDDDGKLTQMVTKYDLQTKVLSFETTHFSYYMIGDDSSLIDPTEDDDKGGVDTTLIAGAVVVVIAVLAVALVLVRRKA